MSMGIKLPDCKPTLVSEQKMQRRVDVRPTPNPHGIPMRADQTPARAEALFKKEEQIREGAKAMAEYKAAQQATREKTARLRALRLARDAAKQYSF
jgi:hypothetical protein